MIKNLMADFIYSAWFLNRAAHPTDQDREWIACIAIEAEKADAAQKWGDVLAVEYSARHGDETFLRSSVELQGANESISDLTGLPRIKVGELASDAVIGW